jgi:hypothetical protein
MKKKRLKRQNRILLERCQTLQGQVDALVETYLKYFESKPTLKVSDWIEEDRKRQMRKANARTTKN